MAKKRGGLAGLYDRNKGIFRTAAILGGTALGGPAGGALAGAAMRGFDRPGKRGIGFDVKQGALGGLEGYAMGKTAQAVGGGIKGMFAPKSAPNVTAALSRAGALTDAANVDILSQMASGTGGAMASAPYGTGFSSGMADLFQQGGGGGGGGSAVQRLLSGLTQRQGTGNRPLYYDLLSGLGKGLYSERQSQRTEALSRDRLAEERRQFEAMMGLRQQDAAIAAAQEADRKRREEQLMANRDALRALFTGA